MKCERCGAGAKGYGLLDYCAKCSKNLCDDCMKKGCCGIVPAQSGMGDDCGEETQTTLLGGADNPSTNSGGTDASSTPSSDSGSAISGGCDSGGSDGGGDGGD